MSFAEVLVEVRRIVLAKLAGSGARVFLFGSFADGDVHQASDVDIGILPGGAVAPGLLSEIREALEESRIPRVVEVVDLDTTDVRFREKVVREGIEWTG